MKRTDHITDAKLETAIKAYNDAPTVRSGVKAVIATLLPPPPQPVELIPIVEPLPPVLPGCQRRYAHITDRLGGDRAWSSITAYRSVIDTHYGDFAIPPQDDPVRVKFEEWCKDRKVSPDSSEGQNYWTGWQSAYEQLSKQP